MADQVKQQLMFSLIEIWKQGEQSQQEFCKEKDLDYNQFQYWLRRYKQVNGIISVPGPSFARIKVEELPKASSMELVYPDGKRIIFYQPVEASFLRSLLA
jgi:hypothetical protein